jgi:hypothetical protein
MIFAGAAFGVITTTTDISGPYACTGALQAFTFNFGIYDTSELKVVLINSTTGSYITLTKDVDYSVSATNSDYWYAPGGTVTTMIAYASNYKIVVVRDPVFTQVTDLKYLNITDTSPANLEITYDKLEMQIQKLSRKAIQIPDGDVNKSIVIPNENIRKNKLMGFDANGNPCIVDVNGSISISGGNIVIDLNTVTDGKMIKRSGDHFSDATASDINSMLGNTFLDKSEAEANYMTKVGLGTIVSQDANEVNLTGGNISDTNINGLQTTGTGYYLFGFNADGNAWESKHIIGGTNITITQAAGAFTISAPTVATANDVNGTFVKLADTNYAKAIDVNGLRDIDKIDANSRFAAITDFNSLGGQIVGEPNTVASTTLYLDVNDGNDVRRLQVFIGDMNSGGEGRRILTIPN